MLLPSDVARLVLGYLQEEGLSNTSQALIHESPNLREYADHTTDDGNIPACVFSVFGKGLTTILNEYVATKTKESCHEVPLVMTSLWKKLDFTLNQIKSLQNSPSISASQRARSRIGVANMARQRVLTVASASGVVCSSVSETNTFISPAYTSHCMLGHSTPVSFTGPHTRTAASNSPQLEINGSRLLNTPRDSPVHVSVLESRLNPGPMSPCRRKWDTPRKRSGAQSGSSGPSKSTVTASSVNPEPQPEEIVDENFPQLLIQNARNKILGDRSLQEKLAENINKILANEPTPQAAKASSSTMEADQSIDEILGLQSEIHMSDDAIHDILEQTESDPAFQALFDLFDCQKTKLADGETGEGDIGSSQEENDNAGPLARALQSNDPVAACQDSNPSDSTPALKIRAGQERKTRKSTGAPLLRKTVIDSSGRSSRIENSSARLLVSPREHRSPSSAAVDCNFKETSSLLNNNVGPTPMDVDEPPVALPLPLETLITQEPTCQESITTTAAFTKSAAVPSSMDSAEFDVPEETLASNMDKQQDNEQTQTPVRERSSSVSDQPRFLSPEEVQLKNTPEVAASPPHTSVSSCAEHDLPVSALSGPTVSVCSAVTMASPASTPTPEPTLPTVASTSSAFTATAASSTPASPGSSVVPGTPSASNTNACTPTKAGGDPSNIVSLKIIISDNQDEGGSTGTALNQAVSNISVDKMPTIYLSNSPAKSPGGPGTPKANFDEVAQAVNGLQSSEAHDSPLSCKSGTVVASPLSGTSQFQQRYIIQLPVDTTNPGLQGSPASYFLVSPTRDIQARQVLLPAGVSKGQQPFPSSQSGVTTATQSQGFSTGSAVVLPSPVKPVVLPGSVLGQNTVGKVQMVSNQLVDIPNPVPVQQKKTIIPTEKAAKHAATSGTEENLADEVVQPENTGQQDVVKGPNHKRILFFDSSASKVQSQTAKTKSVTPSTSRSQSIQQTDKDKRQSASRIKPAILGGNKPKRRIETIRCPTSPQAGVGFAKEPVVSQTEKKDPVKKSSRKQELGIHNDFNNAGSSSASLTEKKSESGERSKSIDGKNSHDRRSNELRANDSCTTRSSSSDSALKSGSRKDKDESIRKEHAEKPPLKSREGRTEKRTPSQDTPNVTANKENEIIGSMQEHQQPSTTPSTSASRDFGPPVVTQLTSNTQPRTTKAASKTSSLAKQAAEMLQDIQGFSCPSTPVKKAGASGSDISVPGTGHIYEAPLDCPRTPSYQKRPKDQEGTPKNVTLPNTPEVPGCSPASEAGSENSINMAAHTLMILSRAAIARTGTPLKDSLRQEEAGEKSPGSSKNCKKRKLSSPTDSPSAKRESKRSSGKNKDREKKKLADSFPHDLDVDKFLSSLHYDE
ncbi:protein NPAT [Cololabis saira]|uniref:protein NPAT n=1 Tax=Cololabis saira TaxID=129043 RepID=UPI002AD57AA9|nr:protein NPAT [Cololabis saira]